MTAHALQGTCPFPSTYIMNGPERERFVIRVFYRRNTLSVRRTEFSEHEQY